MMMVPNEAIRSMHSGNFDYMLPEEYTVRWYGSLRNRGSCTRLHDRQGQGGSSTGA